MKSFLPPPGKMKESFFLTFFLSLNMCLGFSQSVTTDKDDYTPDELINITASDFIPNSLIQFQISDDPNDPGDEGEADVYSPFSIQDGGTGDLDGIVYEEIQNTWMILTDNNNTGDGIPDAFYVTINLVALGYGLDEILYTEDDQMATAIIPPISSRCFT
jgi:hypothetical protein